MKVWKKAVSAALCICLAASLFTGFSLTDVAAQNMGDYRMVHSQRTRPDGQ